jgi:iron(III) transport system substrate-binding protein
MIRGRRTRNLLCATTAFSVLTLALAGCGDDSEGGGTDAKDDAGSAAETFEKFNAMTGKEREDALLAAAEEEGGLVFYTASSGMDPVIEAFEDKYDIDVDLYSGQADTVLQRIVQEYEAGYYGVDVYDDSEAFSVSKLGFTHPYVNDELTTEIPGYDPETNVVPTRLSVYTQGWNTDLISEEEIPATLDGFTDPKFDGKLSMDPRDWIWYTGLMDYYTEVEGWSEDEVDEMIETLASYSTYNEGHTVQAGLLLAGEFPVSLSVYTQSVDREVKDAPDAPIAWRKSDGSFVEPLIYQPQGSTLMKNAPHPATAMLFMDFVLSEEGQTVIAEEDGTPTARPLPGGPLDGIPTDKLIQVDFEKFVNEREEWADRYDQLLN